MMRIYREKCTQEDRLTKEDFIKVLTERQRDHNCQALIAALIKSIPERQTGI